MTTADPFAPANGAGLKPYVIERKSWGRSTRRLEYATSLTEAKNKWGWSRAHDESFKVWRARVSDVEAITWNN